MKKLGLAFALVMALGMIGWPSHVAVGSQQAELSGTVTVNGESPLRGTGIIVRLVDGTECGRTTTEEDGTYQLVLALECPAGSAVLFFLAATEDRAATEVTVEDGIQTADIAFEEVPPESLLAIGLVVAAAEGAAEAVVEEAAQEALADRIERPLVTSDNLFTLLLVVVGSVAALLAFMVGARLWITLKGGSPDEMGFWHQIEAIVLIMVIVAVIILGITDKIDQEGLIAILGAIAGYGAGRSVGAAGKS